MFLLHRPWHALYSTVANGSRRVVVAMSGGIDSAVTAHLMKQKGYLVEGIYMRNWDTRDETGVCPGEEDWRDVQEICATLSIPCSKIDLTKEYWHYVFSSFLRDYANGYTPNPDVVCNKEIKFGEFAEQIRRAKGSDVWIATGHYAKIRRNDKGLIQLLRAADSNKDQSYFLAGVTSKQLSNVLFPIGDMTKSEVKDIAKSIGLRKIVKKKESMGICFIGQRKRFGDFLDDYIEQKPGDFIDLDGRVVGLHHGHAKYTVGQAAKLPGMPMKYTVLSKEPKNNTITVVPGVNHPLLYSSRLVASDLSWVNSDEAKALCNGQHTLLAQIRHRQYPSPCTAVIKWVALDIPCNYVCYIDIISTTI
ncbi:tRNA methyl transferase [Paraphysoderma sedebokerense]|nr:tRNA methyl transferase [Paraphysoderma sedebokerense]